MLMAKSQQTAALQTDAFRWGALVLSAAAAVILAALGFEHIGGYVPCPLCLQQRYAYYGGIPLTGAALVLLATSRARLAALLLLAVGLMFAVNAGIGVYHAGAEWGYWPGPQSCATAQPLPSKAADLLKDLADSRIIRCDEASWRFLGLSFAGWNVVLSALLGVGAMRAAYVCRHDGI
jgi:disulfide bond formation protein DsbB